MEPGHAATLIGQVAAALDAAHAAGLVHRDVKPGNVLIEPLPDGTEHAYLADFGLSKRPDATPLTDSSGFMGTPDYAAPEQVTGMPPVSARTD
jgi:serine/threonine-protein kinase